MVDKLKLDFAKAFDTVEHEAIIQVMRHKGFNEKWMKWSYDFLSTRTSAVLLMVFLANSLKQAWC
jgi:hypothetical protein